jgi:hypothetical protein
MIISINTLIISSIIAISGYGLVTEKMELYQFIFIPIVIIVLSSLISAILAILAAKPGMVLY